MVNEFRTGYNNDNSKRQSNFKAAEVAASLGLENAPSKADAFGFPSFQFIGGHEPSDSTSWTPAATSIAR